MWRILQQEESDDYVIGTGESHSVREFVELAFDYVGIEIAWKGEDLNEMGILKNFNNNFSTSSSALSIGDCLVLIESKYFRPTEVEYLEADITKAKKKLNWCPKVKFEELVKIMMDYELMYSNKKAIGDGIEISKNNGFQWTNHEYSLQENR